MKTVSVCIVDNNIVKGFKKDKYTNCIVKYLHDLGFVVQKVSVINNDAKLSIIPEITSMLKNSDFIIISGVQSESSEVFQAIASIYNVQLLNKNDSEILSNFDDIECGNQNGQLLLPENVTVLKSTYSIIKAENIYIIFGTDLNVKATLKEWQNHFLLITESVLYNRFLHVRCNTPSIMKLLIKEYKEKLKNVRVYCQRNDENITQYKIILESMQISTLLNSELFLKSIIKSSGLTLEAICTYNSVYRFTDISDVLIETVKVLEKCFTDYKLDEIFLSFNGGKDCMVLLYLTVAVLKKIFPENNKIQCIYIQSDNPFAEVKDFINETVESYNLPLKIVKGSIREALQLVLECEPKYKAVLMGTRRTDPFSENLKHFQMTDAHWPQIMRVSPILEWKYSDVWDFLRDLQVPYCSLYDLGYTSLGSKTNTEPNEALKFKDEYLPAYLLTDGSLERDGRKRKTITQNSR